MVDKTKHLKEPSCMTCKYRDRGFIQWLTGIRRCGRKNNRDFLKLTNSKENILYCDLERKDWLYTNTCGEKGIYHSNFYPAKTNPNKESK